MKTNILLTGRPGVGKTWVMKQIIETYGCEEEKKVGLINYRTNGTIAVAGTYDGSTFEGCDKLSMAAISSAAEFIHNVDARFRLFDGDRFTNSTFLALEDVVVINIKGDGAEGRKKRGSNQTEARLKAMATRYDSYDYHFRVEDSSEALQLVRDIINEKIETDVPLQNGLGQGSLF